jgi:hypothetical protein
MGTPRLRPFVIGGLAVCAAALTVACGSSPVAPPPPPPPPPPVNNLPVIDSITVQGTRPKEPANFADAGEAVPVSARVHDDETAVDQLVYTWTATTGTFSGTGPSVTWTAPASVAAPTVVAIALTVTEKYGNPGGPLSFEQSVKASSDLSLHDSVQEVGGMSRQFLLDFSDTTIKDADRIMRNFGGAGSCPDPKEASSERQQVIDHYTYFRMLTSRVDQASVAVNFGGACPTVHGAKKGDACAYVGVLWDSIDTRDNSRIPNAGTDQIAAAYSAKDARWFLCSSDYDGHLLSNPSIAVRYPR